MAEAETASTPASSAPEGQETKAGGGKRALPRVRRPAGGLGTARLVLIGIGVALGMVLAYVLVMSSMLSLWTGKVAKEPPKLDKEFQNTPDNYAISPPKGWILQDRIPDTSLVMQGPSEKGFSPIITVALDMAPSNLGAFLKEHKGRLKYAQPDLEWLSEEEVAIDGMRGMMLEYECDYQEDEQKPTVRLHALQFILVDGYRFYRLTGVATSENYMKYAAHFEASMRSLRRLPLPKPTPKLLLD